MNLNDLATFVRVVDAGSFSGAAAELGVPKSTVSRRVSRLEDHLGLELVQRKPRSLSVTAYGRQLHTRSAPALREIDDAQRSLADTKGEPEGTLRITAPTDLGSTSIFARLFAEFRDKWPKVQLDLELTARRVDIIGEGFDFAFRATSAGALPDSTLLMARKLISTHAAFFAGKQYVERTPRPRTPADLDRHPCLGLRRMQSALTIRHEKTGATMQPPASLALAANDFAVLLAATIGGLGVGFLPVFFAQPHVDSGELIRVLPRWGSSAGNFHLVWPASRYLAPRVRVFIDHVTDFFKTNCRPAAS